MYKNIDISNEYEATRTSLSTDYAESVDNVIENSETVADMLEKVTESIVGISRLTNAGGSILNNISSDELGLGTGMVVSDNGYILSNSHVTGDKYSTCYVTIDENTYKGTVVWSDSNLDLSIVKVPVNNLSYVEFGNSGDLRVGETVYAIGNPIGYEFRRTVTSGIISALNRTIKIDDSENSSYISDLIQTDATINPGNSGGPLINAKGEVIGINTVKITSAEGIGFAIPINVIKPVVESFKEKGNFEEATLGIYAYDGDVAGYLNLKNRLNKGVYVSQIIINGPAYNSDLKEGDLISSIDEKNLNTINDLREYIYSKSPGDIVKLEVISEEKKKEIEVILGKK
jgi:S1-C subfamily serine protease